MTIETAEVDQLQSTDETAISGKEGILFFDVLNERRSVRKYDTNAGISDQELREILSIAAQAPSSANLQPWRFLVITDAELKAKLVPIAFNQQQVAEAPAVIILLGDLEMYTRAEQIYGAAVEAGYMTEEVKAMMTANYSKAYAAMPADRLKELVAFDAGLVAMQLMLTARAKGYDTVPMGGYNRDQMKELLGIGERYLPTILLPIGKAAAPGHPSVRLPLDEIVHHNVMGQ